MISWKERAPAIRLEPHFGDRTLRCFVERPRGLREMLAAALERNPDGDALVCGTERLSWSELDERVARAARGLARRGVGRGDRVALLLGNRSEFVVALLAIVRLAAVAVPLSVREQKAGLAYVLQHSGAVLLIHEAELAGRLPAIDGLARVSSEAFPELQQEGRLREPRASEEEDTVAILYTSGTTGRPKGAMLTNLGIVHSAMHYELCMRLGESDRAIAAVPLSHVTGVIALVAAMVRCAGTLVLLPEFKAQAFLALAERERMTYTVIVPAMYNLCLLQPDFDRYDLSAWRIGAYGGAPMPLATIERLAQKLPDLRLMNAYGATETTSPATLMPPEETAGRSDSVGLAVPCAELEVVDGELWIRGPMVVKGYWDDPAASAREFTDGYWHSGDIGSIDAEGFVRVLDRKKDMINRGGYKVYTAEVEGALAEHPDVVEAAVVGTPCPVLGERVHAFVTLRAPGASEQALRAFCAERLADYKVPESFSLGTEPLPRNANGKLLKRQLRERLTS